LALINSGGSILEKYNVGQTLAESAAGRPFQTAVVFPAGRDKQGRAKTVQVTFAQLNTLCDQYAYGLADYGLSRGDRVLLLIRPSIDFLAVVFALMKIGAVPIIIDPGMGRKPFLQCVAETEPVALISIPLGHLLAGLFPKPFRTVKRRVTVGSRLFWGGATLAELGSSRAEPFPIAPTSLSDEAAVIFTSGSTGLPKGVVYRHGIYREQVNILRDELNIQPGEVHLAGLLVFALFNPALGVTTIIPDMDPRAPAKLNPAYLVEAIDTYGVTLSIGSPTIFKIVGDYCRRQQRRLPSLRHVHMFGAAVPPSLVAQFSQLMPNGKVFTPFGATEALPLTTIGGDEILAETAALTGQGAGVCVGYPLGDATLKIIAISDEPIPEWQEGLVLPPGEIGEIVVKGSVVTDHYLHRPQKTAEAKIYQADGTIWHRMGDLGYLDARGRVWVCGRKSHRVETAAGLLLPLSCEAIFNPVPGVKRTALVGVGPLGRQRPVLVVEKEAGSPAGEAQLREALLAVGAEHELARSIKTILFHPAFPVDVRHNAKIQREKLAVWAAEQKL
jgi:acyl-CoA synthetase (AMP-forming)/AMP-acid ligase II